MEIPWFSSKEKVLGTAVAIAIIPAMATVQQSVKKFMGTVFWDMKGPISIDFFEKDATTNSAFFCQLLKQNSPY